MKSALEIARSFIYARFETVLSSAATYSNLDLEITNRRFTRPLSGPWARLDLVFGDRFNASVGDPSQRMSRTSVFISLQIFIPENRGELEAYKISEELLGPFDNWSASTTEEGKKVTVYLRNYTVRNVGKASNSKDDADTAGIQKFNALIEGYFDESAA